MTSNESTSGVVVLSKSHVHFAMLSPSSSMSLEAEPSSRTSRPGSLATMMGVSVVALATGSLKISSLTVTGKLPQLSPEGSEAVTDAVPACRAATVNSWLAEAACAGSTLATAGTSEAKATSSAAEAGSMLAVTVPCAPTCRARLVGSKVTRTTLSWKVTKLQSPSLSVTVKVTSYSPGLTGR